jgi:V8-like Glu-specific endopeptidase
MLLTVFGSDDRVLETTTTSPPYSAISKIVSTFPDGSVIPYSGALIDSYHVLTSGSAVYEAGHGGWAKSVEVIPGQNGTDQPFWHAYAVYERTYDGWSQDNNYEDNIGFLTLDRNIGESANHLGIEARSDQALSSDYMNLDGYPGDRSGGAQLYHAYGPVATVSTNTIGLNGLVDADPNELGGPIYRYNSTTGTYNIDAVFAGANSSYNYGARITTSRFNDIQNWIDQDNNGDSSGGQGLSLGGDSKIPADSANLLDYDAVHGSRYDSFQPSSVHAGDLFTGGINVTNKGQAAGVPFSVSFYAVPASDPDPAAHAASAGYLIRTVPAPPVNPGGFFNAMVSSFPFPSNIPPGDYHFAWTINTAGTNGSDFSDQPNGALTNTTLTVLAPPGGGTDTTISGLVPAGGGTDPGTGTTQTTTTTPAGGTQNPGSQTSLAQGGSGSTSTTTTGGTQGTGSQSNPTTQGGTTTSSSQTGSAQGSSNQGTTTTATSGGTTSSSSTQTGGTQTTNTNTTKSSGTTSSASTQTGGTQTTTTTNSGGTTNSSSTQTSTTQGTTTTKSGSSSSTQTSTTTKSGGTTSTSSQSTPKIPILNSILPKAVRPGKHKAVHLAVVPKPKPKPKPKHAHR